MKFKSELGFLHYLVVLYCCFSQNSVKCADDGGNKDSITMVSIQVKDEGIEKGKFVHKCGGTMITNSVVFTACSCVTKTPPPGSPNSKLDILLADSVRVNAGVSEASAHGEVRLQTAVAYALSVHDLCDITFAYNYGMIKLATSFVLENGLELSHALSIDISNFDQNVKKSQPGDCYVEVWTTAEGEKPPKTEATKATTATKPVITSRRVTTEEAYTDYGSTGTFEASGSGSEYYMEESGEPSDIESGSGSVNNSIDYTNTSTIAEMTENNTVSTVDISNVTIKSASSILTTGGIDISISPLNLTHPHLLSSTTERNTSSSDTTSTSHPLDLMKNETDIANGTTNANGTINTNGTDMHAPITNITGNDNKTQPELTALSLPTTISAGAKRRHVYVEQLNDLISIIPNYPYSPSTKSVTTFFNKGKRQADASPAGDPVSIGKNDTMDNSTATLGQSGANATAGANTTLGVNATGGVNATDGDSGGLHPIAANGTSSKTNNTSGIDDSSIINGTDGGNGAMQNQKNESLITKTPNGGNETKLTTPGLPSANSTTDTSNKTTDESIGGSGNDMSGGDVSGSAEPESGSAEPDYGSNTEPDTNTTETDTDGTTATTKESSAPKQTSPTSRTAPTEAPTAPDVEKPSTGKDIPRGVGRLSVSILDWMECKPIVCHEAGAKCDKMKFTDTKWCLSSMKQGTRVCNLDTGSPVFCKNSLMGILSNVDVACPESTAQGVAVGIDGAFEYIKSMMGTPDFKKNVPPAETKQRKSFATKTHKTHAMFSLFSQFIILFIQCRLIPQ